MVALEGIEDKRFVGLGDLEVGEAAAVGEVEFGHDGLHAETRLLGVHLDVDGFVGLDADDDFVAGDVLEDTGGDVLEYRLASAAGTLQCGYAPSAECGLQSSARSGLHCVSIPVLHDHDLAHTLSCLEDERHTIPALVLNPSNHRAECGTSRTLGNSVILLVAGLAAIKRFSILTNDNVLGVDWWHSLQDTDLLVTDVLSGERDRSVHSKESEHLEQVVLHDITDDAELVKVTSTTLSTCRLCQLTSRQDPVDSRLIPKGSLKVIYGCC